MVVRSPIQPSAVVLFARFFDSDTLKPHLRDVFINALQYVLGKYSATALDEDGSYILAAFNVPIPILLPAYVAMKCATEMQLVFNGLRREMTDGGFKLAIGIHRGLLDVQNINTEAVRFTEYIAQQGLSGQIVVSSGIYEEIKALGDQFNLVTEVQKILPDGKTISLYHFRLPDTSEPVIYSLTSIIRNTPLASESQVLIGEDAPSLRTLFAKVLKNAGFDVRTAANGHDVIAQLEYQLPDVLILDLGLPGVSGQEIIRYLQERQSTKQVKIVVVTGNHLAAQSELANDVELILTKPISPRDLVNFVKRFT